MSALIKRFDFDMLLRPEGDELLREENNSHGDYVLHTDHLAAIAAASAYDEEKERTLFEAEFYVVDLAGSNDSWSGRWMYDSGHVDNLWFGWISCAKARAKEGGE